MSGGFLDDQLAFHRKTLGAGNSAFGAWVRMVIEANRTTSDGRITKAQARTIATSAEIKRLLAVRFLELRDDGDYDIHDFLDWNWSAAKVRAHREARSQTRAEAGRKGAAARWGTGGIGDGKPMANAMAKPSQSDDPFPLPLPIETETPSGERADARARVESAPPPPASSGRIPDPMGDQSLGAVWAEGMLEGLGRKVTAPSRAEVARLVEAVRAHAPEATWPPAEHERRERWLRERAATYGRTKPKRVNVFAFIDWLDAGAPTEPPERSPPRGPAKQPLPPLPPDSKDEVL